MLRVTYPNTGLYANGQPRLEQVDASGQITFSREATVGEAAIFENTDTLQSVRYLLECLIEQMRAVQTYGVRISQ